MEHVTCVCALLTNSAGQVLLQLREDKPDLLYPAHWTILGGTVEPGESPDAAVRRELLEEIELSPALTFWKVYYHGPYQRRGVQTRVEQYLYTGTLDLPVDAIVLNEGVALRWFARDDLTRYPIGSSFAEQLDAFFKSGSAH